MHVNGDSRCLWLIVYHERELLKYYVTKRRDRNAALKLLGKTMKRHGQVNILITAKPRSYGAAMKVLGNAENQKTGWAMSGQIITDEILKHVWPLAWDHINLTGDYLWSDNNPKSKDELRPLRIDRVKMGWAA